MADVIIVLGGGINNDGSLYARAKFRVEKAVELFKQGRARTLLFSGRYTYIRKKELDTTEAEAMAAYARGLGIPKKAIMVEKESMDTLGNLFYCNKIIKNKRWKSVIIVTSDYHVARVRFLAKRILKNVQCDIISAKSDGKIDEFIKEGIAWIHLVSTHIPWNNLDPFLKKRYSTP